MKVAVIGLRSLAMEGGIESFCNYVYPSIIDDGHEVIFYTRRKYGTKNRWLGQHVVSLLSLNFKGLETLSYSVFATLRALVVERVDVVHFQAIGPCLLAPIVRLAGKGVVVRHVGPDWARPKWGWIGVTSLKLAEKCAARWAHIVVCLNSHHAQEFIERSAPRGSVRVIPNAVPMASPSEDAQGLSAFGLESQKYVLSVSRLSQEKGILELIEAYEKAGLHQQGFKLAIAGRMSGKDWFKRMVRERAEQVPGVVMLGEIRRTDLPMLYRGTRLFVNASTHEGMSFSALEALSYGCTCLFSDIPANRFKVRSIRWFDPKTTNALSHELGELVRTKPMSMDEQVEQQDELYRNYNMKRTAQLTSEALDTAVRQSRVSRGVGAPPVPTNTEE